MDSLDWGRRASSGIRAFAILVAPYIPVQWRNVTKNIYSLLYLRTILKYLYLTGLFSYSSSLYFHSTSFSSAFYSTTLFDNFSY